MKRNEYELFIQRFADAKTPAEVEEIVRESVNNWRVGNTNHLTHKSAYDEGLRSMIPAARNTVDRTTTFDIIPAIVLPKTVHKIRVEVEVLEDKEDGK